MRYQIVVWRTPRKTDPSVLSTELLEHYPASLYTLNHNAATEGEHNNENKVSRKRLINSLLWVVRGVCAVMYWLRTVLDTAQLACP